MVPARQKDPARDVPKIVNVFMDRVEMQQFAFTIKAALIYPPPVIEKDCGRPCHVQQNFQSSWREEVVNVDQLYGHVVQVRLLNGMPIHIWVQRLYPLQQATPEQIASQFWRGFLGQGT